MSGSLVQRCYFARLTFNLLPVSFEPNWSALKVKHRERGRVNLTNRTSGCWHNEPSPYKKGFDLLGEHSSGRWAKVFSSRRSAQAFFNIGECSHGYDVPNLFLLARAYSTLEIVEASLNR